MSEEEVGALFIVVASLTTIVLTFARMWFKHQERKTNAHALGSTGNLDQRLDRIEQAVDAIAVEVERLSEGQRFATRLLSESAARKEPLAIGRDPRDAS
ncbi:MAG TPA: hypothetical protein VJ717_02875 [Gemmatimonadaceae bacterium]|nr:hypothetical protein [Gemmatimonadaceae bacterium]